VKVAFEIHPLHCAVVEIQLILNLSFLPFFLSKKVDQKRHQRNQIFIFLIAHPSPTGWKIKDFALPLDRLPTVDMRVALEFLGVLDSSVSQPRFNGDSHPEFFKT